MPHPPHGDEAATGALFSTDAVDNAEVIPEDPPRAAESMWSTAANPDAVFGDDPDGFGYGAASGSATWTPPGPPTGPPPFSATWEPDRVDEGVFSAEPVDRVDDVIDEWTVGDEVWDVEEPPEPTIRSSALFSSGVADTGASGPNPSGPNPWREAAPAQPPRVDSPTYPPPSSGQFAAERVAPASRSESVIDYNGIAAATAHLSDAVIEAVAIPLMLIASVLDDEEVVQRVLCGQMLGRSAVVALTPGRVIVANDRRWDPALDVYLIAPDLLVRGRRDDHVAAMTLADDEQMSMIDGIADADGAVEMAELIRTRADS